MPTGALYQSAAVQLDASGNGTASLGPIGASEVWHPGSVHVSVTTNTNEAVCNIYVGDAVAQQNFRDATFTGSSGDSSDRVQNDTVKLPHRIFAVWTGGDPRSTATIAVTGSKDIQ